MEKLKNVDDFFDGLEKWKTESLKLRSVVNSIGLQEMPKWSMPVYVYKTKNVVGIFATKTYFGLWFYQGALLTDEDEVLINAAERKTRALRQWRMSSAKDIKVRAIKKYIVEAMNLVEQGRQIKPVRNKPIVVPAELQRALAANPNARTNYEKMSKTCRREYADYISDAKKPETKLRRIEKILPMILSSTGLNDKYR
ncbi:MAG: YdeI family protein [Mariniblastus sp.]